MSTTPCLRLSATSCLTLLGLPGSGARRAGRLLAQELGLAVCDLDRLLEASLGCELEVILDQLSPEAYRVQSAQVLARTGLARCVVLASSDVLEAPRVVARLRLLGPLVGVRTTCLSFVANLDQATVADRLRLFGESLDLVYARRCCAMVAAADLVVDSDEVDPAALAQILRRHIQP